MDWRPMAELAKVGSRAASRRARVGHGPVRDLLAFRLGEDTHGVPLTSVREILSPPPITRVPRAPRGVLGVCSVRGLLVTVVDLRVRLGLPKAAPTRRSRILLTTGPEQEVFGVMVDEVKQVLRLAESQIEAASTAFGTEVSEHVIGMGRPTPDEVMILIDLGAIVGNVKEST